MKTITTLFLLLLSLIAEAQFEKRSHTIKNSNHFEKHRPIGSISFGIAGEGLIVFASLDIRWIQFKNTFISTRTGIGLQFLGKNFPHSLSFNYGWGNLIAELGVGRNVAFTSGFFSSRIYKDEWVYGIAGLKYQYLKKRFEFRLYTNPMFDVGKLERNSDGSSMIFQKNKFMMYMGFSIGAMF